jgi:hypothetical protein
LALNIIILHFTPSWGVTQVFPGNGDFDTVDINDSREFSILGGKGTLKAWAMASPSSLRAMEMPEMKMDSAEEEELRVWTDAASITSVDNMPEVSAKLKEPTDNDGWEVMLLTIK